jgi:hypothetical protein
MMSHSDAFLVLRRQVAKRHRDLLKAGPGQYIFPPPGTVWTPTDKEQALCEAFIVLFVAELETYFEWVVTAALDAYQMAFLASSLAKCSAGKLYVEKIQERRKNWTRNNNSNWSRIGDFFEFVGLESDSFPDNFWDKIESIAGERGGIVHQSGGVRSITDPRIVFEKIESVIRGIKIFDRDYMHWNHRQQIELTRLYSLNNLFVPGLGSVDTSIGLGSRGIRD